MTKLLRLLLGIFSVFGLAFSTIALTQAWSDSTTPWLALGLVCVAAAVACITWLGIREKDRD